MTEAKQKADATRLTVENLWVDLGSRSVLNNISMRVEGGEQVGLIGPNGAGKTTLMRSILGLVPTRQGQVNYTDSHGNTTLRNRVGYVPQRHEFSWDFPLSIQDVVLSGRVGTIGWFKRPTVNDFRAVNRAIARVDLSDLAHRPVGALSGGQRQRVLVARALALEPELLLLDEPFTGLDIPTQELLLDLFSELAQEGRALLMTTHDLASALHTFDRLYLINRTVTASGTPAQLRDENIWRCTFGFSENSQLLQALGLNSEASARSAV
ncbi:MULTISPECIES: anchored repeat-type ABC transporter ATP-binding subunit [Auritidibacter]|uniref:anchored repeat-type ABC transporter ATP-binding subunit n=1 Tax=Auritidibacter TaxID=1160973 RepID=UPI000D73A156|nr:MULTISPECIES: anchored repeat-type ABC transporter ATP-binding subunit [Auritidibacter]AXR73154.1 anchored repeat-type ABC transporter ATP-binding subunit [Auritidibacter sp. NML130574]NIH71604.1 manganese/iron transport system ATP-binding protein [Auritidibacter ignavus]PXA81908.1 anchored repeat-type ABC transporter ATP-binding subunit [Auritidibacter sp. NML120636]RMX24245.1 anchored repeat-type ABC transporter ATP-binding subunit [Auritidibacter ignavus]WGH81698.1 anchored repeat-type A